MDRKPSEHEIRRDLEAAGEEKVRNAYNRGAYSQSGELESFVRSWLENKKAGRDDAAQTEQLAIARSAADAAWAAAEAAREAAREAKTANRIATLALIAAVIAIAVAIVSVFAGN
jgi:hypothetical protein